MLAGVWFSVISQLTAAQVAAIEAADLAVMDTAACACGRGLPMLREIQGRATDFVRAQNGTVMHGLALIYILRDLPGLQRFKIG